MRRRLLLYGICAALFALGLARAAHADPRQLVARLVLLPQSPGGQIDAPNIVDAAAVPPARFDVFLDPELNGQALDAYLADRQVLLCCRYTVWLYRFDDENALGKQGLAGPTLVIDADAAGQFPLAGPAVIPGRLYAWQAVANLTDSAGNNLQVWSAPLYFRTAPAASYMPEVLEADAAAMLAELAHLASEQQRACGALQASLRGLLPYSNYPSASDVYLSIPLAGDNACPRPDAQPGWRLDLPRLIELGRSLASLRHSQAGTAAPDTAALISTGSALYSQLQGWTDHSGVQPPKSFAMLVDVTSRLRSAPATLDAQQAASLLSEFVVSADQLAGSGTVDLRCGYEAAFMAYAGATQERLARARRLRPQLEQALGQAEAAAWLGAYTGAGQQVSALAEEVQRGRLGKNQLTSRLASLAPALPADLPAAGYLEAGTCRVAIDRTKYLVPADKPQIAQLTVELARCYLAQLAAALWPR